MEKTPSLQYLKAKTEQKHLIWCSSSY